MVQMRDRRTDRQTECSALITPNDAANWQFSLPTPWQSGALPGAFIRELLNCLLVDLTSVSDAKDIGSLLEVDTEHVELLLGGNCPGGTVIDSHGMSGQAMLLLQLGVEQVQS